MITETEMMCKVIEEEKETKRYQALELERKSVSREERKIVKEMVEKGEIIPEYDKKMNPNECRAPRLTGYPKVHKNEFPLRGVVSFIRSPYEKH